MTFSVKKVGDLAPKVTADVVAITARRGGEGGTNLVPLKGIVVPNELRRCAKVVGSPKGYNDAAVVIFVKKAFLDYNTVVGTGLAID